MEQTVIADTQKAQISAIAKKILKENIYDEGEDQGYTAASGKMPLLGSNEESWLYPFQWLWDTFFICAWSGDTEQSITDSAKFLNAQQSNGFCGHIRYNRQILAKNNYFPPADIYYPEKIPSHGEIISKITQPPNIGYGLLELTKKIIRENGDLSKVKPLFHKAIKYHDYIYQHRIIDGCMVTIHPWEAGDDNSPKWDIIYNKLSDIITNTKSLSEIINEWLKSINLTFERVDIKIVKEAQRPIDPHYYLYLFLIYLYGHWKWNSEKIINDSPFRVFDPMTNAVLLKSDISLLELACLLEEKDETLLSKIQGWIEVSSIGLEKLWSEKRGLYFTKDLNDNSNVDIETISCYSPIFSCGIKKERAETIAKKLDRLIQKKETNFLIPSTPRSERKSFDPERYWRGPVWIITNEIIAEGLDFYGYTDISNKVRQNSLSLILHTLDVSGGFYEYYNPITGAGLGSAKQSWTAAAILNTLTKLKM